MIRRVTSPRLDRDTTTYEDLQTAELSLHPGRPLRSRGVLLSGGHMSQAWRDLGGKRRTLARQVYARDRSTPGYVCPPCRQPIDWSLPYKDPDTDQVNVWSKSVDHGHELQDGGAMLDPDNCWSAHLTCNSSKGATRRHERTREARRVTSTIIIDPSTL